MCTLYFSLLQKKKPTRVQCFRRLTIPSLEGTSPGSACSQRGLQLLTPSQSKGVQQHLQSDLTKHNLRDATYGKVQRGGAHSLDREQKGCSSRKGRQLQ